MDADVEGPQPHGFAAGFTTWYLERMEAGTPMLLEARDDTATRQGDGPTEYDGAVQPAIGMEVERSTDRTGGADRDAAGTTTVGSTDTTATSAGVVGMEAEGAAEGAPAGGGGRSGPATEAGTTAMQAVATRRYRAGASQGLTRGARRKLARAKKKAAR